MDEVSRQEGRTVLFVSHNMNVIDQLCPTSIWLDQGSIRQYGSTAEIIKEYLYDGVLNYDRIVELHNLRRPYFGGDEVHLTSIEWLGDLPLRHGEGLRARIAFEARAPVSKIAIGIGFCDIGGRRILSYDTDLNDCYRPDLPRPGIYAAEVEIDALPLNPNTYALDILCCARDGVGQSFDFIPAAVQLEVLAGPETPDFLNQYRYPQVHLDSRWRWNLEAVGALNSGAELPLLPQ